MLKNNIFFSAMFSNGFYIMGTILTVAADPSSSEINHIGEEIINDPAVKERIAMIFLTISPYQ